jgi:hypothetical protein
MCMPQPQGTTVRNPEVPLLRNDLLKLGHVDFVNCVEPLAYLVSPEYQGVLSKSAAVRKGCISVYTWGEVGGQVHLC